MWEIAKVLSKFDHSETIIGPFKKMILFGLDPCHRLDMDGLDVVGFKVGFDGAFFVVGLDVDGLYLVGFEVIGFDLKTDVVGFFVVVRLLCSGLQCGLVLVGTELQ